MTNKTDLDSLNYFNDVRCVEIDQLGMATFKAIAQDPNAVLSVMAHLDDRENAVIHEFLTSGVANASDTRQDLIDKITKHTPIVTIEEPLFHVKQAANLVLRRFNRSFRFTPRYNWGVPARDCVSIRIVKEMVADLNALKKEGKDIEMDIKVNIAVLKRKEYTFDLVKQSKMSFKSVENQIQKRKESGK